MDRPVSVLIRAGIPGVAELAEVGVARISVGSSLTWVALGAMAEAAAELSGPGTFSFLARAAGGRAAAVGAFTGR